MIEGGDTRLEKCCRGSIVTTRLGIHPRGIHFNGHHGGIGCWQAMLEKTKSLGVHHALEVDPVAVLRI